MPWVRETGKPGEPGYMWQGAGEASMSPETAQALGYHWEGGGTYGSSPPTQGQYIGILAEKQRLGQYGGKTEEQVQREIEIGRRKYGEQGPPWGTPERWQSRVSRGAFISPAVKAVEQKWAPYIKEGQFTGNRARWGEYDVEYRTALETQEKEYAQYQADRAAYIKEFEGLGDTRAAKREKEVARQLEEAGRLAPARGTPDRYPEDWSGYIIDNTFSSPEVRGFESRWAPAIQGEQFIGTESQYSRFLEEQAAAYKEQERAYATYSGGIRQYNEAVNIQNRASAEAAWTSGVYSGGSVTPKVPLPEYPFEITPLKEFPAGYYVEKYPTPKEPIRGPVSTMTASWAELNARTSSWLKQHTPSFEELVPPEQRYETWHQTWQAAGGRSFPADPYLLKMERTALNFEEGMYEGIREKPVKVAATAAAFFVLPAALKGTGWGLKSIGLAPESVGGMLPEATALIPKAAGYGMVAAYAGSTGYRVYSLPPAERYYKMGEISSTELLPMIGGTAAGYAFFPRVHGLVTTWGKEYVPIEEIGTQYGYPTRGGLTEKQITASFRGSTLAVRPTNWRGYGNIGPEPYPEAAVLPGESAEGVYGWHAIPRAYAKSLEVPSGSSELPGMYHAPILEGYFAKAGQGVTAAKGFGIDFSGYPTPSAVRTHALDIGAIPRSVRAGGYPEMGEWITGEGRLGKFWEPLMKIEYEAVLPSGTKMTRLPVQYYTKIKGVRTPIYQYEVSGLGAKGGEPIESLVRNLKSSGYYSEGYNVPVGLFPSGQPAYKPSSARMPSLTSAISSSRSSASMWSMPSLFSLSGLSSKSSFKSLTSYPSGASMPSFPSLSSFKSLTSYPSGASMPSFPSLISTPSKPSYPSLTSKPSKPSRPSWPSWQSRPSKPSGPSEPSQPSEPSWPSMPSEPSYPVIPTITPPYPQQGKGRGKKKKQTKKKESGLYIFNPVPSFWSGFTTSTEGSKRKKKKSKKK
jgi:hypothetical protein